MRKVRGENAGRSLQGVTQPSKVRQAGDRSAQHSRVAAPWTPHGDDEKHFKALNQAGTGTGTLSESKGIRSMHQSHSLWLKGLRLKVSITVLWSPICLWGGGVPTPSFLLSCHLFFRFTHQMEELSKPCGSMNPPSGDSMGGTRCSGCHWEDRGCVCGVGCPGWVPAHPRKLLYDRESESRGVGRKAPVWLYNWGATPLGCIISKQKRGCWLRRCLQQGSL